MLVIRLQRTGRKNQPAYRMVVAEKTNPVKGKHIEILGTYNPSDSKRFDFKKDRVEYWLSVGAQASDTVAGLLTSKGMSGLEKFITPRTKTRPKKNPTESELAQMEALKNPAPAVEEMEEVAVVEEAPAEETVAEEVPEETPVAEEASEENQA